VYNIEGQVNKTSTINDMRLLAIVVKPRPGSGDIDLNNTYVLISDGLKKTLIRYGGISYASLYIAKGSAQGSVFNMLSAWGWLQVNNKTFALAVMQDYDSSMASRMTPVMNRGDKAILLLRCDSGNGTFARQIPERTDVFGQIVPERGSPGVIAFQTPMSYADLIYNLQ
jgi:flagellin FlaB